MNNDIKKKLAVVLSATLSFSMLFSGTDGLAAKKKASLNKKKLTLQVGKSFSLKVKMAPAKAKFTWKSTKVKVATVSKKGKVVAKKVGKTTIQVKVKAKKFNQLLKCSVTVNGVETKSTNKPSNETNAPGKTSDAPTQEPTQKPTEEPTPAGPTAEPTPTMTPIPGSLYEKDLRMNIGAILDTSYDCKPKEGKYEDYTVSVDNETVATVDEKGYVTGRHLGQCNIILTSKTDATKKEIFSLAVEGPFLPEDKFFAREQEVPHGEVKDLEYPSDYREGGKGHAMIYLPPNYDPSKKYNLVFCLHGGGQDEFYWTTPKTGSNDGCAAHYILDNMYSKGEATDSIVVFTLGTISYNKSKDYPNVIDNPFKGSFIDWYLLEFEIVNNLLPYMNKNYPVVGDADHTGVCGLSMGCGQTMEIGFKHPELFHWMGCFSAGPYEDQTPYLVKDAQAAEALNKQLKMCLFITGKTDTLKDNSLRKFIKTCDSNGLNSMFFEIPKCGHDDSCWERGFYAFMKYAFK